MITDIVIWVVLIPATIAGVAMLAAWRPWTNSEVAGWWGGGFGFAAGYATAHYGLNGEPETMWYILGGLLLLAVLEAFSSPVSWTPWIGRLVAVPSITYLVAGFMFTPQRWSGLAAFGWPVLFTALALGMIATLETYGRRESGSSVPISLLLVGNGAAITFALTTSARVGELVGVLTSMAGAAMVLSWIAPKLWESPVRVTRGGVTVFVMLLSALSIYGYASLFEPYQSIAGVSLLLLAASPHLMWLDRLGPLERLEGWKATGLRVVLVAGGVGAAVGYAYVNAGGA